MFHQGCVRHVRPVSASASLDLSVLPNLSDLLRVTTLLIVSSQVARVTLHAVVKEVRWYWASC